MTICRDNPRLSVIGCGATYSGELQHSVARCDWSSHLDGRAHITGSVRQIDMLWRYGTLRNPADTDGKLRLVDGRLREPASEWHHSRGRISQSDENVEDGSRQRVEP